VLGERTTPTIFHLSQTFSIGSEKNPTLPGQKPATKGLSPEGALNDIHKKPRYETGVGRQKEHTLFTAHGPSSEYMLLHWRRQSLLSRQPWTEKVIDGVTEFKGPNRLFTLE
jgi:hypothetical protein